MRTESVMAVLLGIGTALAVVVATYQVYEFSMNVFAVYSFEPLPDSTEKVVRYPNLRWDPLVWACLATAVAFFLYRLCRGEIAKTGQRGEHRDS
ncbi:hypothetical protein FIU96_11330 [Marinobacter sp. THAF39]|nr:hypothetical protein FIV08_11415 [Marinobacter sp. THAF197a]QFT51222.1 hypothetical protein FIU96_11330 [Marinobacter sp. THAF39]